MRTLVILCFVLVLAAVSCFAQQPIVVPTPYGNFQFNVKVTEEKCFATRELAFHARIAGDITNNTNKDWIFLKFTVTSFDKNGLEFQNSQLSTLNAVHVKTLKKGETLRHVTGFIDTTLSPSQRSSGSGDRLTLGCYYDQFPFAKLDIKFTSGTISAKYAFVLLTKPAPEQPSKTPIKTSGRVPVKAGPKPAVIEDVESSDLTFVDKDAEFRFSLSKEQIGFVLRNKSDGPIEIDWNQFAYVDVTGESHKVFHKGVKFVDRDNLLVPTTIPPSARIEDIVLPTDYVYFSEAVKAGVKVGQCGGVKGSQ